MKRGEAGETGLTHGRWHQGGLSAMKRGEAGETGGTHGRWRHGGLSAMKWDEVGREGRDTCAEWRPSSVHVRDSPGPHEGPGESVTRGEQTDCKRKDEWASADAGTLRSETLVRSEG